MGRNFQIKFGVAPMEGIYSVSFEENEKINAENHIIEN
jgi:hypothetical protein